MKYDYKCDVCDTIQEVNEKITETAPEKVLYCAFCAEDTPHKKYITNLRFNLPGGDWASKKPKKYNTWQDWHNERKDWKGKGEAYK